MAGLDQAQGATALTGFTLNEIIKQQQPREAGSEETAARLHVYPLFSVGGFKSKRFILLLFSLCVFCRWEQVGLVGGTVFQSIEPYFFFRIVGNVYSTTAHKLFFLLFFRLFLLVHHLMWTCMCATLDSLIQRLIFLCLLFIPIFTNKKKKMTTSRVFYELLFIWLRPPTVNKRQKILSPTSPLPRHSTPPSLGLQKLEMMIICRAWPVMGEGGAVAELEVLMWDRKPNGSKCRRKWQKTWRFLKPVFGGLRWCCRTPRPPALLLLLRLPPSPSGPDGCSKCGSGQMRTPPSFPSTKVQIAGPVRVSQRQTRPGKECL